MLYMKRIRLLLSKPRGFCAGVDRAIETVQRALALWGAPIYVKHEIVHNKHVVEDLKKKRGQFSLRIYSMSLSDLVLSILPMEFLLL